MFGIEKRVIFRETKYCHWVSLFKTASIFCFLKDLFGTQNGIFPLKNKKK